MTNGLGGWSSMTIIGSCSRNDHAFFMACKREESPNHRINVIHRLKETLWIGEKSYTISSQDYSDKAKNRVRMSLESINGTLREGCIGQIAEIYDGLRPVSSRGCFAQAWSVGKIIKVYDVLEGNYGF